MDRISAPSPANRTCRKIVTKKKQRTPPLRLGDHNYPEKGKHCYHEEIKYCWRQDSAGPSNVKSAQADASKDPAFLEQPGADQKTADRKEQAHAVGTGVSKSDDPWLPPQGRIFCRVIEQYGKNRNRPPAI